MLVDGRGSIAKVQYTGDEDVQAIKQLLAAVVESEDEFEKWEPLVTHAMSLEGGVTRNSSPSAIELVRNVYDCFLAKFPLFFGYWKKYADFEFAIGGTDTAEMIYERGVACIPTCVDLWRDYCEFKMNTCHDPEIVRELFERAADFVTMDFQSHPFWDKYIEFEDRNNDQIRKIKIWRRVFQLPNYYFGKYYEKFRNALGGDAQQLEEIVEEDVFKAIKASVDIENQGFNRTPPEIHRQIYAKLDEYYLTVYTKNQAFLHARWHFEQAIKRAYFHVTELEDDDLENWRKYLDFEEKEGTFNSISALYERCLVPCALYEEFWLRYARWLFAQNKEEECRIVYTRASCIFVPISQPTIRLNWARYEEKLGYVNKARDIHMAILEQVPDHVETIISLAGVDRRHKGNDAAVRTLDDYINGVDRRHEVDDPNALDAYIAKRNSQVGGVLAAEQARILWKCKGAIDEARQIFKEKYEKFLDSKQFWLKYLEFEASQISSDEEDSHARVKAVHDLIRTKGRFPPATTKELSHYYMEYLLDFAGKDAAGEFMLLDREINGSKAIRKLARPAPEGDNGEPAKKKRKNRA